MVYYVIALFAFLISKPPDDNLGISAVKFIPPLVLVLGIIRYTFYRKGHLFVGRVVNRKEMLWYSGFLLIYVISIVRKYETEVMSIGTINQSLQVLFLGFYAYAFFSHLLRQPGLHQENFTKVITLLLIPPILFIVLNAGSYVMGFTNPIGFEAGENPYSVLASLIGLTVKRTGFLFSGHPNNFAPVVGLIAVMSILALQNLQLNKKMRVFLLIGVGSAIFGIILADSRGTFMSMLVTLSTIFLLRKINKLGLVKLALIILPMVPFILSLILPIIAESGFGGSMSRDANEVATANGRVYIWEGCMEVLFDPEIIHIVGYGQVGHLASGAADSWAWVLPGFVAHNFLFQVFLDQGYLGIIFMIGLLILTIKNSLFLYRRGYKVMLIFLAFPVYFLFSGLFESIFGVYNQFYSTMFILLTLCPILFKNAYLKGQDGHVQVPLSTLEHQTS